MNADSIPNPGIDESRSSEEGKQISTDASGRSGETRMEGQSGGSNQMTIDNLPQDVKDSLPEAAQNIFVAAYNSFLANSHDEEAAKRVAWQTIERNEHYTRGGDGKWYRSPDESANTRGGVSTMPGG
ncbi:ChaB family protein [Kovacikia minuta CCNUW1]|uniref:ChaB family protein n=1 Tax=Kovacikia minuta TaxID=2931930 RepID=UPI001CD0001A|nr:ChaB family protein [Kovacikia minuta]UBF28187.1 ChaB family protein [Kovacikia minuta CCNUW1]